MMDPSSPAVPIPADRLPLTPICELNESLKEQRVHIRARIHTSRKKSNKLAFFQLREQCWTIQAVAAESATMTRDQIKAAAALPSESIVEVVGIVNVPPRPVTSCTQSVELSVQQITCLSRAATQSPFVLNDAMRSDTELEANPSAIRVNLNTRLDNRFVDLRTPANQAIFRIQAMVGQLFREYMGQNRFIEIHSPKLVAGSSEGGANVFKFKYFDRDGCLAQSPQLYKQMMICSDFQRVFEIGPVFRAENSDTHRHLCEFVGLDFEMEIQHHYHEVLHTLGNMFVHVFDGIKERCAKELTFVNEQHPFEELVYPRETLILQWQEAVTMLREAGVEMGDFEDLSTEKERTLGRLVKERYNTDLFILDSFPTEVRPFYTMPNPEDPRYSRSFDCFLRGEEITSGAQRIHIPEMLEARGRELGITIDEGYLNSFRYGAPPHGGAGVGLERVVMLMLNLGNVRKSSLFPRDPSRLTP
eukprot:gnl/Trimastix_PCT/1069.p2 GENE.gnl/Trimastix_PCT/1069~~gnl/Trimastix_PCT/1069.p2  ORF type:complete len:474 (+),score=206.55 gnl/Trimastix_PCT/1069:48-1469(+)